MEIELQERKEIEKLLRSIKYNHTQAYLQYCYHDFDKLFETIGAMEEDSKKLNRIINDKKKIKSKGHRIFGPIF